MADPNKKLSLRVQRFVREYAINGHNGRAAAIEAGYPLNSAANRACDILKRIPVQTAIDTLTQQADHVADRAAIADINEAKAELTKIIRADIGQFMTAGRIDPNKIQAGDTSIISEITELKTGAKVILHSKMVAIDRLSKLSGWDKGTGGTVVNIQLNHIEMKICGQSQEPEIEVNPK